jgi:uncharacterized membrane protein YkgB
MWRYVQKVDDFLLQIFQRYGHRIHRISLGFLFLWFGILKPLGHDTTTSLLAHTIYWGDPGVMVLVLGWWEVGIGLCLLMRPVLRAAIFLLALRVPGILLAFVLQADVCFVTFPFTPTPEGQYLIKDLALFFAALAIASFIGEESTADHYH